MPRLSAYQLMWRMLTMTGFRLKTSFDAVLHLSRRTLAIPMVPWALLTAASLLAPGEVFAATPIYAALRRVPIDEGTWGGLMALDGLALALTAFRGSAWVRAGVAAVSAPFWCFFGAEVLIGAAQAGIFSATGAWCAPCRRSCLG